MKPGDKVEITPEYCENIPRPENMKFGVLYISEKYETCNHLCLCGCGQQSPVPLMSGEWTLTKGEGGKVSLTPSFGNWLGEAPNYHAHYVITDNIATFC